MGRAPCCDKNGLKRGPWTPEEDQKLLDYIQTHGPGNWRTLPKNAGLQRCGKSCRLRWTNYLRPDIKRGKFSFEEEETIIHLHSMFGNKWSAIASRLPGRTDNEIKNYWNTHIRKRLLRMGIDPVTHNPRLDLLDLSSIFNQSLYNQQYTTNPNSQFRLLGLQPMVNPEILKLATSIFSRPTQPDPNSTFTMPTTTNSQIQNQEQFFQTTNLPTTTLTPNPCFMPPLSSSCDQEQALAPIGESLSNMQAYDNLIDLGFDDHTQSLCANTNFAGHLPNLLDTDRMNQHNYLTCYNESTFGSNDQNMMGSMFSGLSSNSTPLHSNSNSNSTYINTEDERESYCSNLMRFEFPADLLDVSEYL